MQWQLSLFLVLLLSAGCTAKQSAENNANDEVSHHGKPTVSTQVEYLAEDCIEKIDEGIEFIKVTKEWAEKKGRMDVYQSDPGFDKWRLLFHDFPGDPPYSFDQKRLLQQHPDRFYPCGPSSVDILKAKLNNIPAGMVVGVRGYLPGEQITIRLSGKDAYKEITFCPRPLILKKSGHLLAKAILLSPALDGTMYHLNFCGVGEKEKYKFISRSGKEVLSHNLEGPVESTYMPGIITQMGGVASITLQFQDGTRYSMKLPWGYEFLEYQAGTK